MVAKWPDILSVVQAGNPRFAMTLEHVDVLKRRQRESAKTRRLTSSRDAIRSRAEIILRFSGLKDIGRWKALELRLVQNTLSVQKLAPGLNGCRLLQISDPHYPEQRDLELERIEWLAAKTAHDITVLTGDYRDRSFGPFEGTLRALESLRPHFANRAVAILGNHDPLDLVEPMTRLGHEVLLNRTITLEHG